MKKDHKKAPPFASSPSEDRHDAWLDALPEKERADLKRTWALAAQASADKPTDEAIEAASARFWSAVDVAPAPQQAPLRQAVRRPALTRSPRWALGSLAIVFLFILGLGAGWFLRSGLVDHDTQPAFLVLIRGGDFAERTPEEQAHIVTAFSAWAEELSKEKRLVAGEQLAQEGYVLARDGGTVVEQPVLQSADHVGGYFVLTARDYDEALALASACPQLDYGGMVEVRQIVRP